MEITLRNLGSSPAELLEIVGESDKCDCLADIREPQWRALLGSPRTIRRPIVGVGEDYEPIRVMVNWTKDDMDSVFGGARRVAIYGMARYRSGSKKPYYTRFFYWFSPVSLPELQRAYSEELNQRT